MSEEEWRPVVGYEGLYEVSSLGRVRSLDRWRKGKGGSEIFTPGRVLKPGRHPGGYLRVALFKNGRKTQDAVHRLVARSFLPNPRNLPNVLHGANGVRDNSVGNLRWGTQKENVLDEIRDGTHAHARKTHCIRGHEFTPENTNLTANGSRQCKTCFQIRASQGLPPGDPLHGSTRGYRKGCRCAACTKANTDYYRELRNRE